MTTKIITLDLGELGEVDFQVDYDFTPPRRSRDPYEPDDPMELTVNSAVPSVDLEALVAKYVENSDVLYEMIIEDIESDRIDALQAKAEYQREQQLEQQL